MMTVFSAPIALIGNFKIEKGGYAMKKIVAVLCAVLFAVSFQVTVLASVPIRIIVNGNFLEMPIEPFNDNGTLLVPARVIFEKLGLQVGWDGKTRTVTGVGNGTSISMVLDKTEAVVNGKTVIMLKAPRAINGNTLVPLRFVAEATGALVNWNNDTRIATVVGENVDKYSLPVIVVIEDAVPPAKVRNGLSAAELVIVSRAVQYRVGDLIIYIDPVTGADVTYLFELGEREALDSLLVPVEFVEVIDPVTGQSMSYEEYQKSTHRDDPFGWKKKELDAQLQEGREEAEKARYMPNADGMISERQLEEWYGLTFYWPTLSDLQISKGGKKIYLIKNVPNPMPKSKVKVDGIGMQYGDTIAGILFDYNDLIAKGIIVPKE